LHLLHELHNKDEREDDLLYQLQCMFGYLQESQKQFYNPRDFCNANKDYDGNPTDVCLQQDVDEFFNMLVEKVESGLKGTKQEKLLQEIWCGTACTQLMSKPCKHCSQRDEPFHTISLDIAGRANIVEALEMYVKGEMLEGDNAYFCEKCSKRVDTLMRRCIKTLPKYVWC
jgi:ubiquitin C-terminal hydrolase